MSTKTTYHTFCQSDDPANISVYESKSTVDEFTAKVFTGSEAFKQHINTASRPQLRIVSIHSVSSLSPLKISRDALEALLDKYNVGPDLWDLVSTFGNKPLSAAAGEGALRTEGGSGGIQEISYRFTFPVTGGPGRWTMRQAGIFHRQNPKNLENLWIFLHVGTDTPIQKELIAFSSNSHKNLLADTTWFTLHQAVLNSCLNDWRSYINFLGKEVDRHFDRTLSFIHESMNNTKRSDGDGNIADIHNARNRLLEIPSQLMTTLETLQKLENISRDSASQQKNKDNGFGKLATSAIYYKDHLEPLLNGVEIIKERVKDTLNIIEISLSFRMTSKMLDLNNRMVDVNKSMLDANKQLLQLGNRNFDDNATVRIVTLVTLIYLPASLVSSVIGMNLFNFEENTGELIISKQFWIFVVATIILAIITLGGWYVWTHQEVVLRRKSLRPGQDTPQGAEQDIELDDN